jgi:hypothetical protein
LYSGTGAVVRRHREVRRALEHGELRACSAMTGIDWMADEPVPITATRLPVKSTPSCGQRPV